MLAVAGCRGRHRRARHRRGRGGHDRPRQRRGRAPHPQPCPATRPGAAATEPDADAAPSRRPTHADGADADEADRSSAGAVSLYRDEGVVLRTHAPGRGRPHRHHDHQGPRQGAGRGQGGAPHQVEVRRPPRAPQPRDAAVLAGAGARHREPGRGDRHLPGRARGPRPGWPRPTPCSRSPTSSPRSATPTPASTTWWWGPCAPSTPRTPRSWCPPSASRSWPSRGRRPWSTSACRAASATGLVAFDIVEGGVLCRSCRRGRSISPEALELVRRILGGGLASALAEPDGPARRRGHRAGHRSHGGPPRPAAAQRALEPDGVGRGACRSACTCTSRSARRAATTAPSPPGPTATRSWRTTPTACATEMRRAAARRGAAPGHERLRRRGHAVAAARRAAGARSSGRSAVAPGAEVTVECNPEDAARAALRRRGAGPG